MQYDHTTVPRLSYQIREKLNPESPLIRKQFDINDLEQVRKQSEPIALNTLNVAPHGKSAESHRSFLLYIDKLIPVTQIILTMFLSCIIAELVFLHAYHTIFISIVVWISCITAVVLLGMLIFRFIQWFKTSNDRLILSYAFALGLIILNCGIILAYINTTLESRPKLIPSTYASVKCQV